MPKGKRSALATRYAEPILHVVSTERPGVTWCGRQLHLAEVSETPAQDHAHKRLCETCLSRMPVAALRAISQE